jgi:hypothetical protein
MKKIIALAALAVLSAGASAATNLFTNGSFEDASTAQAPGAWSIVTGPTGWTVSATGSTRGLPVGLEVRDAVAGTAEDGANFIELDGNQNDKISQTFAVTSGKSYEISFWYADRSGVAATSEGFGYTVTGQSTTKLTGSFGTNWHEATIDFTAAAGQTSATFSIWALGSNDSFGTSFDNFSAVTVVPEPGTLGLFAAGLAVLGLSARRRRQQ